MKKLIEKIFNQPKENYDNLSPEMKVETKRSFHLHVLFILYCIYVGVTDRPEKGILFFLIGVALWLIVLLIGYISLTSQKIFKNENVGTYIGVTLFFSFIFLFLYWFVSNWGK